MAMILKNATALYVGIMRPYAIEHTLRAKGDRRSWHTIKQILQSHQAVTVVMPDVDNKHIHHVRLSTKPNAEQKEIYDRLGIKKLL